MSKKKQKWFFLRGLVRESGHWSGFLERFAAAFPEREVVPLDLPGNGVRFREPSPLSVPAMTAIVRQEFLSQRGEENYVFALSLGAMVALSWLNKWPDDLQGAVLVNTSARGLSPPHHRLQPGNYLRILKMVLSGKPEFVERNILEMTSNDRARHNELTEAWVKIHQARPVSVANAARQLLAASRFHPPLGKPSTPVLILNGAGDKLVNPSCSERLAKHWKLPVRVHPTAGHDLSLDAPDWVIEQLRDFPGAR